MVRPMLASLAEAPLDDPQLIYEPKYDGIRAIAEVPAGSGRVRLWSRLGNEKSAQFPEVTAALERWARRLNASVVLDGEIVALDADGEPVGFQYLQGRIHLGARGPFPESVPSKSSKKSRSADSAQATENDSRPLFPVAFIAFDLLREGRTDWRDRPLVDRRAALERIFGHTGSPILRISEVARGDGRRLYKRALASGWEGLIAKRADSVYKPGKRSPDWRKLKIVHEQEFVVGGWTEPRQTRPYFGALLLGVYETAPDGSPGDLTHVGHTGTGFTERELARVMALLRPLEASVCPFRERPRTNERPHWVKPELVAQIKFTEWTADGKLRHSVYLGLRDDKDPREVRREPTVRLHASSSSRAAVQEMRERPLEEQLRALEDSRRDGVIHLPDGHRLSVTNLHKIFWPKQKLTKGDLFRYYVQVAPFILPAVADRPLVMKRYPNGMTGQPFYQHRVTDAPDGVRIETVTVAQSRPHIIGGNLLTLLYTTQLAAISQDPWFSRAQTPAFPDHAALDLDPMPGVPFGRVLDVARWIRDELDLLGTVGVAKTSGADGMHVYVPLRPTTPYEAGLLLCQIVATVVAQKHPKVATIERPVRARGARVYIDYLQNILGKTLATAYSARASEYGGVSTPLSWDEVDAGVRREDFTIQSIPARVLSAGDLWAPLRKSKGVDLSTVARYAGRAGRGRLKGDSRSRSTRSSGSS